VRWAVTDWAKTFSQEVAKNGITVNIIMPRFTQTPYLESLVSNQTKNANTDNATICQKLHE
jgi:hypothetical protein